jgi:hypothetical protein
MAATAGASFKLHDFAFAGTSGLCGVAENVVVSRSWCASPCMADAMFAPVVTHFLSYDAKLIMTMPPMREWVTAAKAEPDEVVELDVEF